MTIQPGPKTIPKHLRHQNTRLNRLEREREPEKRRNAEDDDVVGRYLGEFHIGSQDFTGAGNHDATNILGPSVHIDNLISGSAPTNNGSSISCPDGTWWEVVINVDVDTDSDCFVLVALLGGAGMTHKIRASTAAITSEDAPMSASGYYQGSSGGSLSVRYRTTGSFMNVAGSLWVQPVQT